MSGFALLIQTLVAAYLVIGEPLYGRWEYRRLVSAVDSDPAARTRFYRNIVLLEWGLTILALLTLPMRGEPLATFVLRQPLAAPDVVGGILTGGSAGLVIGLVGSTIAAFVSPKFRAQMQVQLAPVRAMLPVTAGERLWFALVAVTAGVCEELLFRGFFLAYLQTLFPGISPWVLLIISSAVFGMAHLYQGRQGVLMTGLTGAMLGALYLATGSLVWPMILHALMDIRVAALPSDPGSRSAA